MAPMAPARAGEEHPPGPPNRPGGLGPPSAASASGAWRKVPPRALVVACCLALLVLFSVGGEEESLAVAVAGNATVPGGGRTDDVDDYDDDDDGVWVFDGTDDGFGLYGSDSSSASFKFYLHVAPALTSDLLRDAAAAEGGFGRENLNEYAAELWLLRGLERHPDRTDDPAEADAFFVPALLHLSLSMGGGSKSKPAGAGVGGGRTVHDERLARFLDQLGESIDVALAALGRRDDGAAIKAAPPHVLMCPAMNAPMARQQLKVPDVTRLLTEKVGRSNVYAVSFERNAGWAGGVPLDNVVVAPYVVKPALAKEDLPTALTDESSARTDDFVFYVASRRKHAVEWAGCDRGMVLPLKNESNMKVGLDERMPPDRFQRYMLESDYCLITCGDTPTSRRLSDSMAAGCIPIFVGTRLFGECVAPCFPGWGWTYTKGKWHLPYEGRLPWSDFPVVDEARFAADPKATLVEVFRNFTGARKAELRSEMRRWQSSFVYGWGSALTSDEFGSAVPSLWESVVGIIINRGEHSA